MIGGLIGKKVGMTQVFDATGNAVAVTVIEAGPCVVVQKREREEVSRLQLGLVGVGRKVKANKPLTGHFKRADVPPALPLKEFDYVSEEGNEVNIGDQVLVQDVFKVDELVDVAGRSKGRGFQGVIKRHGFRGGRKTHGSMFHRAPGSIGASAYPSRVLPGMRAAGHMGDKRTKIRKLRVVEIDGENNLLLVKGSIPGARGSYVLITHSY
jgi:large subunit ribosomal protein L3